MSAAREDLLSRIHRLLPAGSSVREVSMFGGTAIMLEGAMLVSVGRDGSLLVRLDPEEHDELLARPGASGAVMGKDRPMGRGWITVDNGSVKDPEGLRAWVRVALRFAAR